jgi:hypothetical protein
MSVNKIVSITDGSPIGLPGDPDEEIVDLLKRCLTRAKSGEISQIAISWVTPAGSIGNTWRTGDNRNFGLSASIALLNHEFQTSILAQPGQNIKEPEPDESV